MASTTLGAGDTLRRKINGVLAHVALMVLIYIYYN